MKKLLLILLCIPFIGLGQSVPQGINYQAVARDASSAVLMNQNLTIQFSVISDITTSAVSWQETHQDTTNAYGLFTAIIGQGTSTSVGSSATFDVIDWGASNHLLKVEIDYGGGFLDMGTTAFMSVPYALHSLNIDANPPLVLPANSTNITTFGDRDLFDDGDVRIWLDDLTTDDIELEITNTFAPPGSVYHVSWTNFQSGGVGGATNVVDLNAGGVTSSTTLDFNFTTDEYMTIRIWSPAIGLTWGFYEIKIIKSNSLYTGIPVLCSVRKSF